MPCTKSLSGSLVDPLQVLKGCWKISLEPSLLQADSPASACIHRRGALCSIYLPSSGLVFLTTQIVIYFGCLKSFNIIFFLWHRVTKVQKVILKCLVELFSLSLSNSAKHNDSATCWGRCRIHPSIASKRCFREAHDLIKFLSLFKRREGLGWRNT